MRSFNYVILPKPLSCIISSHNSLFYQHRCGWCEAYAPQFAYNNNNWVTDDRMRLCTLRAHRRVRKRSIWSCRKDEAHSIWNYYGCQGISVILVDVSLMSFTATDGSSLNHLFWQRITATVNNKEQKRMLMDLDVSMRSRSCNYTVHFYGAMFREVLVFLYRHSFVFFSWTQWLNWCAYLGTACVTNNS